MEIAKMDTEDLKSEAMGLYQSIYVNECYGPNDLPLLLAIQQELEKRGWVAEEVMALTFVEKDEDDE